VQPFPDFPKALDGSHATQIDTIPSFIKSFTKALLVLMNVSKTEQGACGKREINDEGLLVM